MGTFQNSETKEDNSEARSKAARVLQSGYRDYRSRREGYGLNLQTSFASKAKQAKGGPEPGRNKQRRSRQDSLSSSHTQSERNSPISPTTRWNEAINSGGLEAASKEQHEGKNDAKTRWKRTGFYAERITGTDGREAKATGSEKDSESNAQKIRAMAPNKQMEASYWLEMVDSKHRYGTNLKGYHAKWNEDENTTQNFFYWLDHGDGKHVNLDDCPREQLDKERVMYLNAEQRRNYLVDVKDGKLYWHRNGRKVDTAKGRWEDLGGGRGIGRKGEKDNLPPPSDPADDTSSTSSSESSLYSSSDSEAEEAGRPEGENFKEHHYKQKPESGESKHSYWTSPRALMDVMLRKTINSNTWIYVCDSKNNLYVGIKSTGGFQHSSFLYGSTVASAGLLKAKRGQLTSLSPLSGHYRAGTKHFKAFCQTLRDKGVDMSSVNISKSLVVIGGIEKYGAFSKKKKSLKGELRRKLHLGPNKEEREKAKQEEKDKRLEREAASRKDSTAEKQNGGSAGDRHGGGHESDSDDGETGGVTGDLHEGMDVKDMTDQQRAERAIALIRSAFSKGVKGEKKEVEKDSYPAADDETSTK